MRIGIYGGSFNPIHKGHTNLAHSLVEQGLVDEMWLLVSPLNPLKQESSGDIADYQHRIRMAELAVEGLGGLKVSDFESRLPVPSYTITTLNELKTAFPKHDFTLVIGADNWTSFSRWYKADEIVKNYSIIIYRREGYDVDATALPANVVIADTPLYNISSTEIRRGNGSDFLDEKVAEYIVSHNLYSR